MALFRVDDAQVRDAVTGEFQDALIGQPVKIVLRDTTTAAPIFDSIGDPIPGSILNVTAVRTVPRFWVDDADPSDLYLDWLDEGSGARGPVNFDKVLRDSAAASADAAEDSATAADASRVAAEAAQAAAEAVEAGAVGWDTIQNKPPTFPPASHTHDASAITTGLVAPARLGGGTASGSTVLYGDGQWRTAPTGGGTGTAGVTSWAGLTGAVTPNKEHVGLGNVDNTSDLAKPISTATQAALNGKLGTSASVPIAQVTGLQPALDSKRGQNDPIDASLVTSGQMAPARMGSGGVGDPTKFLGSDGVWRKPAVDAESALNEVIIYGDSWVSDDVEHGAKDGGKLIHELLSEELGGVPVYGAGYGGSNTRAVASNAGVYVHRVSVSGNQIPVSGTFAGTLERTGYMYAEWGIEFGYLAGVYVKVQSVSGATITFQRVEPGPVVPVKPSSTYVSERTINGAGRVAIVHVGGNDHTVGITPATRLALYKSMDRTRGYRMVASIYTPYANNFEITTAYTDWVATMETEFGDHCLNMHAFLVQHGLNWAGLTPTTEDTAAMAAGKVPPQLLYQDHPTEACRRVMAKRFAQYLTGLGLVKPGAGGAAADTTPPTAPTSVTTTSITSTGFTVNWVASTDAVGVVGYDVYVGGALYGSTSTGTSLPVTGRVAGTSYAVTVRARDAAGNSSASSAVHNVTTTASSDAIKPSTPTGLAVSSITDTTATVTWSASTDNVGVTGYEVQLNTVAQSPEVTVTTKDLTGLLPDTAYEVKVRARDAAGNWSDLSAGSAFTTEASAGSGYTLDTEAGTIVDLRASGLSTGVISTWTPTRGLETAALSATGTPEVVNGLTPAGGKAVKFVRSSSEYMAVDWTPTYSTPMTIIAVARLLTTNGYIWAGHPSGNPFTAFYYAADGDFYTNVGAGLAYADGNTNWNVHAIVFDGSSSRQYMNSTTPTTVTTATGAAHSGLTIGANGSKSTPSDVEITRFVMVNRALTQAEIEDVIADLKAEHGIA